MLRRQKVPRRRLLPSTGLGGSRGSITWPAMPHSATAPQGQSCDISWIRKHGREPVTAGNTRLGPGQPGHQGQPGRPPGQPGWRPQGTGDVPGPEPEPCDEADLVTTA